MRTRVLTLVTCVTVVIFAATTLAEEQKRLSVGERSKLHESLLYLYRHEGSLAEIESTRKRLIADGILPSSLEPAQLIRKLASTYASEISMRSGQHRKDWIERALRLGLTEEELRLVAPGPPDPETETRLVDTLLALNRDAPAWFEVRRLRRFQLSELSRTRILDATEEATGRDIGRLMGALTETKTADVLERYWQWASDPEQRVRLRKGSIGNLVLRDDAGLYRARVRAITKDSATPTSVRLTALRELKRLNDPPTQAHLLELAKSETAPPSLRRFALGSLPLKRVTREDYLQAVEWEQGVPLLNREKLSALSRLSKEESDLMWRALRSPEEPVEVRGHALRALQTGGEIERGDETYLSLLQSDPSLDFRVQLANGLKHGNGYPAGDAAIAAAIEEVRRQAEEARASTNRRRNRRRKHGH